MMYLDLGQYLQKQLFEKLEYFDLWQYKIKS